MIKYIAFCFLLIGLASWVEGGEILTLEDCVREALQNNPDLGAAREAVQRARFQHIRSFNNFFPQLSLDAGYNRADSPAGSQLFNTGSGGGSDIQEEYSLGLSIRQSLFSGFRDRAEVDRTRAGIDAAEANLSDVKARVSFELKSAYTEILFTQEQLKLAKAIADRRKENVRLVELRYEAGREHKGSLLKSQAAYYQAEFEVSQAERALLVARRNLARVLGRQESNGLEVTGDFEVSPPEKPPALHVLALQTPAHLQPEAQARSAQAGVVFAEGRFYPEIDATGSLSHQGRDWPPDDNRWSAGVVISFPLFTGGRNFYELQDARAEHRRALEALKSADNQIILELEQAFAAFRDSIENTEVRKEFLKAAEVRAEIGRSLYTSGLFSFEDWDLIESELINAQKAMIASLRDRVIAAATWERAQGKGVIP